MWEHKKTGKWYSLLGFAVDENTLLPVVIYKALDTAAVWIRPCHEFFDGRFVQKDISTPSLGDICNEH